jgi:CheY-like chemotaxis protein
MSSAESPRILSVEDNEHTRLLLDHALQDTYDVSFASDGEEALDLVEAKSFDLLLLDINLGSEDGGTQLLHTIRDREDLDDVPAIALTAFAMPGDREEFLNEGFDAYVGKPFTQDELTTTIERTLPTEE